MFEWRFALISSLILKHRELGQSMFLLFIDVEFDESDDTFSTTSWRARVLSDEKKEDIYGIISKS